LAAMINHINQKYKYHILTIEDPIEFIHPSQQSLINQREIGNQCHTFADALKYALREDPDVILVGEMRDLETIALAMTAAETGHLVFGTLHTRGAGPSVDRIIDSFPANQQSMIRAMLADSLVAVISQSLLKRADGKGRIAAFEILIVNHAISNLIREGKTFQIPSIIQTGKKEGMMLMDQNILDLVTQGIVEAEEAEVYMEDPTPILGMKRVKPSQGPPKLTAVPGKGQWASPSQVPPPTVKSKVTAPAAPVMPARFPDQKTGQKFTPLTPPSPTITPPGGVLTDLTAKKEVSEDSSELGISRDEGESEVEESIPEQVVDLTEDSELDEVITSSASFSPPPKAPEEAPKKAPLPPPPPPPRKKTG